MALRIALVHNHRCNPDQGPARYDTDRHPRRDERKEAFRNSARSRGLSSQRGSACRCSGPGCCDNCSAGQYRNRLAHRFW